MIGKMLQQVYPSPSITGVSPSDPHSGQDSVRDGTRGEESCYQLLVSAPGRWEGRYLLDDGGTVPFLIRLVGQQVHVWIGGESYVFSAITSSPRGSASQGPSSDEIVCSVPGVVLAVHVSEGDMVEAGQEIVVVESMKTEQVIKAPRDGTIQRVSVQPGDRVDRGMRLLSLVPLPADC